MAGYVVANYRVTNLKGYARYLELVGATLGAFDGKLIVADFESNSIEGEAAPVTVVVEFPTKAAAGAWYKSPEYQAVVHHRTGNSDGILVIVDEFVPA